MYEGRLFELCSRNTRSSVDTAPHQNISLTFDLPVPPQKNIASPPLPSQTPSFQLDVTSPEDCTKVVAEIAASAGHPITCLVNNAGLGKFQTPLNRKLEDMHSSLPSMLTCLNRPMTVDDHRLSKARR